MKKTCIAFLTGVFISSPVLAQDPIETLQITGSRIDDSVQGSFTVMSRAQIEQINPVSTLDLLRRIPNVQVAENGAGGVSFVSLRGGESNFTLILIDGVVVNDSTNSRGGGFDFSQINPEAIESVEVYRGGISAIYGGEAISGVIHIKTRTSAPNSVGLEIGTDEVLNGSVTLSETYDNGISILASLSSRQKQQASFASSESRQGLLKASYAGEQQNHQLLVTFSDAENVGFAEDSGGELFALPMTPELRDSEQWLAALSSEFMVSGQTSLNASLSWLNREEASMHPGIAEGVLSGIPPSQITSEFDRLELEIYASHQLSEATRIIAGVTHRDSEGKNDGELDFGFPLPVDYTLEQQTQSVFVEGQYRQARFAVNVGWRYDDSDNFDSETSLRLGTTFNASEHLQLFAVYNEGYKLPSFFALAHPLVGNAELQPERSENVEVGLTYSEGLSQFSFTVFDNQFTDLVDFDAALFTNVNRSSVDTSGMELSFAIPLANWLVFASDISYVEVSVDGGESQLRRRPQWFGNASLDATTDNLSVSLFMDFRDRYLDSSIATGLVELGGYAKYGLAVNWQATQRVLASFNIDNMLAHEYQESIGFVYDEANLRVGLRYQF